MKLFFLFILLLSPFAQAETYDLKNLKGVSVSHFSAPAGRRQYFRFQNELGLHTIVYEESSAVAALKELDSLERAMWAGDCAISLECSAKAFCTGDCRNMYYETANADPSKNKCKVKSFSCGRQ